MNSETEIVNMLFNVMLLLLFISSIRLNANPVIISSKDNNSCFEVTSTKGNSLYYHSEIFGTSATVTLRDVEAFKYYCTNDLILSTIIMQMVGQ